MRPRPPTPPYDEREARRRQADLGNARPHMCLDRASQQDPKNAVRKSKKSCELITPSRLKSAPGPALKNAVRKSKKSWLLTAPELLKSARQSMVRMAAALVTEPHRVVTTAV